MGAEKLSKYKFTIRTNQQLLSALLNAIVLKYQKWVKNFVATIGLAEKIKTGSFTVAG
jgi:hypothetical protein